MATVIIRWWIQGLASQQPGQLVENYFMNGPYGFWTKLQGEVIELTLIERGLSDVTVLGRSMIKTSAYREELRMAANAVMSTSVRDASDVEVDRLKRSLASLDDE